MERHEFRGTFISLLRRELRQWYAPVVCRRQEKRPFTSGPPVPVVVGDVLGKGVKGLAGYGGYGGGQISAYYNVSSAQDLAGGSIDLGIGGGEGWGAVATSCSAPEVRANWSRASP